jgi:hypothetical protein
MKRALFVLLAAAAFSALIVAPAFAHTSSAPQWNNLLAGSPHYYGEPGPKDAAWYESHKTLVGWVGTWNDGDNLHVIYYTNPPWVLMETHVAVYETIAEVPQTNNGNPKVGKFPYKNEGLGGVTVDEYVIPLSSIGVTAGDDVVIAAHAVVSGPCGEETAWANCGGPTAYFSGKNWATYFGYTVQS